MSRPNTGSPSTRLRSPACCTSPGWLTCFPEQSLRQVECNVASAHLDLSPAALDWLLEQPETPTVYWDQRSHRTRA